MSWEKVAYLTSIKKDGTEKFITSSCLSSLSFKDKKKRFHDSKSICHLQIHRTDIKRGINHNNSAK